MNDLEKTIINLDFEISELERKGTEVYKEKEEIVKKKINTEERIKELNKKIDLEKEDLHASKIFALSMIAVPVSSIAMLSIATSFALPTSLTLFTSLLAGTTGYSISKSIANTSTINETLDILLCGFFPNINKKDVRVNKLLDKLSQVYKKLEDLKLKETQKNQELNSIFDKQVLLSDKYSELTKGYFKKIKRDILPYYTSLEDAVDKSIIDPEQFYANICNCLSEKERKDILENIKNKTCENCETNCELTTEEKTNIQNCHSWYNQVEIGKSKVLRR